MGKSKRVKNKKNKIKNNKTKKNKKHTKRSNTRNKTTKKKHMEQCAPRKDKDMLTYTCYTKKTLYDMKNIWNMRHPDNRIKSNKPYNIWRSLKKYFSYSCKKESCWLKHKYLKDNIDSSTVSKLFAPKMPDSWKKKPNEWLSSVDIMKIMKQYENKYNDFEFLGPSPIDYDAHKYNGECVWEELCEFSLKKTLDNGKKRVGIIFNLDPHYKQGSHWVAVYIDTIIGEVYYFDSYGKNTSYGTKVPSQIKKFMKNVQLQSIKMGKKYKLFYNRRRHQYGDSECGMYCLYVIIEMLNGVTFKKLNKKKIPDLKMLKLRKVYFNE